MLLCGPMLKHRQFPGRLAGTDFQFTVRRANPRGVTAITRRERYSDRKPADRRADTGFVKALWECFGDQQDYDAELLLNVSLARGSFPEAFEA